MNNFDFFLEDKFNTLFDGKITLNRSMKNLTTFKIGGTAPIFFEPENEKSFVNVIKSLTEKNIKYFILGGGSNIVLPDTIDFAIISTKQFQNVKCFKNSGKVNGLFSMSLKYKEESEVEPKSNKRYLYCDAGANWGQIVTLCAKKKLVDFEEFCGLPGTVGGAIFINATCFGLSTCDNLISVRYLDLEDFEIKTYKKNQADWGYKKSPFQTKSKIILSAEFELTKENEKSEEELKNGYRNFLRERALKKHFEAPSAGSVFRNIPEQNIIAGKIIEECGLKGTQIGGAKVANWHGNFIINEENATAEDVKNLVNLIKNKVKEEKNIDLKCEIIFVS